ncbi:Cadherin EGF LAG seven-pass G-type receptor 2 [Mizuhopecten yessoensis]|uniref:Cadherin EGF LAG seven-pass G-type receptor 2 n=2 Tax=Mizuhopecten yessoensis TaxID=6573 RepID=A0A210PEP7_MIZYE|nr:Cadherin EGF LAG seven-pass G-type receptor 2 [Mizuhopecten yessoensis]
MGAILDFETLPNQYRINVIDLAATDGSGEGELRPPPLAKKRQTELGNFVMGVLTINITDVNEPPIFNDATYSVTVLESKIPLDPFVRLPSPAFDADVNDTITYEINSIFPNINGKILAINRTSGNIKLFGEYDVDNNVHPDVLIITVKAVDESGLSSTVMLYVNILDVNDNDPVFTGTGNYVILLPYDYAGVSGTEIGYVHADDDDGTDIVSYSLATRNTYFSVNRNTGYIQLTNPLPVDTISSGVYQFNIRATSFSFNSEGSAGSAIASVKVFVVPFCTDEEENGCNLCNESSSDKTNSTSQTTLPPRVNAGSRRKRAEGDSTVNTCPKTLCSRCHAYLSETCLSGTVPLSTLGNSPTCSTSQTGDVSSANIRICWILPLVITVAVAAVIIGCCLYKRQQKNKNNRVIDISNSKNTTKPDVITTIEPTTELGNFRKPVVIQG